MSLNNVDEFCTSVCYAGVSMASLCIILYPFVPPESRLLVEGVL